MMFNKKRLSIVILTLFIFAIFGLPCNKRKYSDGLVCVCNETYCDTLENIDLSQNESFILVSSSKEGLRFTTTKGYLNSSMPILIGNRIRKLFKGKRKYSTRQKIGEDYLKVNVTIQRKRFYQKIMGFGGAFTGTVSYLLQMSTKSIQHHLYKSYYSNTTGIAYTFMRIPIGASDFDLEPWAYNLNPINDKVLSNFTKLDERDLKRIIQIQDLQNVTDNNEIKFIGAAWSCPPWMKTKPEWSGRDFLKEEFYQTWVDYHLQFLHLMSENGVRFWAISTGNEPFNAVVAWLFILFLDLGWTAKQQGKWVGENLGPALRNSTFNDVKLLGLDDQRYQLAWWFQDMDTAFPNATEFLDGIAVHWYRDKMVPSTFLDFIHNQYPDKFILNTESSIVGTPILGSWERGERYALGFIEDLNHYVMGWIDWNLVVDLVGGPNYARNFVDAPIIINTTAGEFYKQPIYYVIGHFSRFFPENSVRIETISSHNDILVTGCQRPDGSIALIIYNKSNLMAEITIFDDEIKRLDMVLPRKSIHTLILK